MKVLPIGVKTIVNGKLIFLSTVVKLPKNLALMLEQLEIC